MPMIQRCAVDGCSWKKPIFRIPLDAYRAQKFLIFINKEHLFEKDIEDLHNNVGMCIKHFERRYISVTGRQTYLIHTGYPTLNPPTSLVSRQSSSSVDARLIPKSRTVLPPNDIDVALPVSLDQISDTHECPTCMKNFKTKLDLSSHVRRSHLAPDLTCLHCKYTTKYKFQLTRHMNKCPTKLELEGKEFKLPLLKMCPMCNSFECHSRIAMINHYEEKHGVEIDLNYFDFANTTAFEEWRKRTESAGCFRFVLFDTKKDKKVYRCFRDGFFKSKGTGKRQLKLKGSCKIGGVCPCSLIVVTSKESGAVKVTYTSRHVGHTIDIGRMNLSTEEKRLIGEKLSQNVPMDVILDSIKDSIDGEHSRLRLTTRKDLSNIKASLQNIFKASNCRRCPDDSTSVESGINSGDGSWDIPSTEDETENEGNVEKASPSNDFSGENLCSKSCGSNDVAKAKEAAMRLFSSILQSAATMDHVNVINEALYSIRHGFKDSENGPH